MKLTTIVFLHKIFHFAKKLRRNLKIFNEKPLRMSQKINFSAYFKNFLDYAKNRNICDPLPCVAS